MKMWVGPNCGPGARARGGAPARARGRVLVGGDGDVVKAQDDQCHSLLVVGVVAESLARLLPGAIHARHRRLERLDQGSAVLVIEREPGTPEVLGREAGVSRGRELAVRSRHSGFLCEEGGPSAALSPSREEVWL